VRKDWMLMVKLMVGSSGRFVSELSGSYCRKPHSVECFESILRSFRWFPQFHSGFSLLLENHLPKVFYESWVRILLCWWRLLPLIDLLRCWCFWSMIVHHWFWCGNWSSNSCQQLAHGSKGSNSVWSLGFFIVILDHWSQCRTCCYCCS